MPDCESEPRAREAVVTTVRNIASKWRSSLCLGWFEPSARRRKAVPSTNLCCSSVFVSNPPMKLCQYRYCKEAWANRAPVPIVVDVAQSLPIKNFSVRMIAIPLRRIKPSVLLIVHVLHLTIVRLVVFLLLLLTYTLLYLVIYTKEINICQVIKKVAKFQPPALYGRHSLLVFP